MENDKDVIEFRIAMDYLDIKDWESIPRFLALRETMITNVQHKYRHCDFKVQIYQILLEWKRSCPKTSNIEELIKALRKAGLNGPALDIENAIKTHRNDGAQKEVEHIEIKSTTKTISLECVSTEAISLKEIKKIKTKNSNVMHVSFSHDGVLFSSLGKGNYIEIWEWASLSLRFKRVLANPEEKIEAYAAYFNDVVIEDNGIWISVCTKKQMFIYKIQEEMPLVCRIDCDESVTYGSWFKRDEFLSGSTKSGSNYLWLNRIIEVGGSTSVYTKEQCQILHRNDIKNATLLKTYQNKTLLCFKQGGNLEVVGIYEDNGKAHRQLNSKVFTVKQGNVGFFKLSSDLRNLFVLMDKERQDIHQFLKIELEDLKCTETTFEVHIPGPHEYYDFGVTADNVIIGSHHERSFFVCNLESKKCKQILLHKSKVCSVACHPKEPKTVITSDRGGNVLVWKL